MKKYLFLLAVAAGIAIGGTSLAVYGGSDEAEKAPAPATVLQASPAASASGRTGCGGNCCGGTGGSSAAAAKAAQIESYLVDFYTKSIGPQITVEVRDFGCHHEADVMRNGQIIKRLSINGGSITDITEA